MPAEVKVTRFVRTVLDGKLVVCRPGDWVAPELAVRVGLISPEEVPARVAPAAARLPRLWRGA